MQGNTAGINMAGGKASFDRAIPMNAIGFMGLHIITAGTYDARPTSAVTVKTTRSFSIKRMF